MKRVRKAQQVVALSIVLMLVLSLPVFATDAVTSSADISSIRLIEHGWIEIIWANNMLHENSTPYLTTANNYDIRLNGVPLEIETIRHWTPSNTYMTSIQIKNWEEVCHHFNLKEGIYDEVEGGWTEWNGTRVNTGITLQIKGDLKYRNADTYADKGTVYDIQFAPFYTRELNYRGVWLRMSNTANTGNFERFKIVYDHMMKKSDAEGLGMVEKMGEWGLQVVWSGSGQNLHYCPEYRDLITYNTTSGISSGYGAGTGDYPTIGLAGSSVTSASTIAHEVAHCVQALVLGQLPEFAAWTEKFGLVYMDVVDQGMYLGDGTGANNQFGSTYSYALQNSGEFWAQMNETWWNTRSQNNQRPTSRQALAVYHPDMYDLLSQIYYAEDIPGLSQTSLTSYNTPFLRRYVPNANQVADSGEIAYTFGPHNDVYDGQYFSLLSKLQSHIIGATDMGEQLTTWWDYSHTSYNYNFCDLSWIVTPVEVDGVTYYQFTSKGTNPLISNGNSRADDRFGDGTGVDGVFYPLDGSEGTGGNAIGVLPDENVVGGAVRIVERDLEDDNQLWRLVSYAGRQAVLVNKASGLTLSTEGGVLPGDGTPIVLAETTSKPSGGAVWYVRQLKLYPYGGTASSLTAAKYSIIPDVLAVTMAKTWFDEADPSVIWIEWNDEMPDSIAGDATNYHITVDRGMLTEKVLQIDPVGTYSRGNLTRLQLMEPLSEAEYTGIGVVVRLQFTGDMVGQNTGLPADNGYEYYLRVENSADLNLKALKISSDKIKVEKGDYFNISISFREQVESNAAILALDFDASKFEYRGFTPADGVSMLNWEVKGGTVFITVMVDDYATTDYGSVLFSAYEDITSLGSAANAIDVAVQYVIKGEDGGKRIEIAYGSTSIYTVDNPFDGREVTLIDLSNIIDIFGYHKGMEGWYELYSPYDFIADGMIDIGDIVYVAQLIKI